MAPNSNLKNANFSCTNLKNANLTGATLDNTILENAILLDCKVEIYQLKIVNTLKGATMPDGSKYDKMWRKRIDESNKTV